MNTVKDPEPATDHNHQVMMEFWGAAERRDVDTLSRLVHPDVVMSWPQSGERFSGRDNAIGALQAQEEPPEVAGEPRLLGCGDVWVSMVPLRYGADVYQYVGVFELVDGLVQRTTELFGAPFPANPARARFADPDGAA